ncbi:hypothetical protein EVAR_3425_1 [Eumeta japonica]|uniref:Uncharacterized protein n=1 Tax=Eumeta variegata TaxID=151549 RepID=A0A4C1ST28_EUMVA|nr:hypothetical protein EVAR_3425_1 [Eumeta japonica]
MLLCKGNKNNFDSGAPIVTAPVCAAHFAHRGGAALLRAATHVVRIPLRNFDFQCRFVIAASPYKSTDQPNACSSFPFEVFLQFECRIEIPKRNSGYAWPPLRREVVVHAPAKARRPRPTGAGGGTPLLRRCFVVHVGWAPTARQSFYIILKGLDLEPSTVEYITVESNKVMATSEAKSEDFS